MAPRTRSQTRSQSSSQSRSQSRSQTCSAEFSKLSLGKPRNASPRTSENVAKVPQRRRSATPTRPSSNHRFSRTSRHKLSARTLANKTSSELQALCAQYHVNSKGPKNILTQRLVDVSQKNDNRCHAILVSESKIPGKQGTISDVKGAFYKVLEHDTLLMKEIKGQMFVANEDAIKYAEAKMDMVDIQPRLDDKNDEIRKANDQRNAKDKQIKMLQDRLSHMSRQMDLHGILRNRFISAYKRDELDSKELSDKAAVEKGNEKVHSGNAVLDAYLFQPCGSRDDVDAYKSLYGLAPSEILDISIIGHHETLALINRNATIAASRRDTYSKAMRKAFERFITLFRESNFDQNYMQPDKRNHPVRRAYDKFWKCTSRRICW